MMGVPVAGSSASSSSRSDPQLRGFVRAGGGEVPTGKSNDTANGLFEEFHHPDASVPGPAVQSIGIKRRAQEMGMAAINARAKNAEQASKARENAPVPA